MIPAVGDYHWRQLSMWEFAPEKCIEKFERSSDGKHIFHYYLLQCVEITSPNSWRNKVVESLENVPESILKTADGDFAKVRGMP